MSLEKLVKLFLDRTGYLDDDKILAIIIYGSRVRKTNKEFSDLDILIIADSHQNYKASMTIEGISIDYNIYAVKDLFDIAYDKKMNNNAYFESVLKTGLIIKNKDNIIEQLESYLDELRYIRPNKKRLSLKVLSNIRELYDDFIKHGNISSYYCLLEMIRTSYNYLKNCSYLSMTKVYDVFSNREFYEECYGIKLPSESFISVFLEGITANEFSMQLEIINHLLEMIKINMDREYNEQLDDFFSISKDEIKRELVILHNKLDKVIEFLRNNHPYASYTYYVTLRQMCELYRRIYGNESEEISRVLREYTDTSNEEKIMIIRRLFGMVEKDYHLDYENYMLKLKL